MEVVKLQKKAINKATEFLKNGGIAVFPTDTVYGFLAIATNKKATAKIYKIKKRPKSKPLAIFVKDFKMAKEMAEISKEQEKILKKKWPGNYTFVLNIKNSKGTIALRIPKYKPLNDLLKKVNEPLAQTSVNISGKPVLSKIEEIKNTFSKKDILIIDAGNLPKRKPSMIIDLIKDKVKILRK
jgi:L-threonylcarbamoyladenylate synthase